MKNKLNCILLIDDDEATNYYNTMIIEEMGCADKVVALESANEALSYLQSKDGGAYPQPDLIFLDINMPRMNGWEFLEAYEKLSEKQKSRVIIVMLTTSMNPDDAHRARTNKGIHGFCHKPLSEDTLTRIIDEHFPD